nr:hypothetical protein [Pandoravirus aubagnensis]
MKRRLPTDTAIPRNSECSAPFAMPSLPSPRKTKLPRHSEPVTAPCVDGAWCGLGPQYEHILPVELQRSIMHHLANVDPIAALCLARTSKQQAAVLDSLVAQLARETPLLVAAKDATPTAGDYLRARAALGPRDSHISVLLWLLEAFVRFLFSYSAANGSRGLPDKYCRVDCTGSVDLINRIAADAGLGHKRQRARAWYDWLTVPSPQCDPHVFDRASLDVAMDVLFSRYSRSDTNGRHMFRAHTFRLLNDCGVELGALSQSRVRRTAQEILCFEINGIGPSGLGFGDLCEIIDGKATPEQVFHWARQADPSRDSGLMTALQTAAAREGMARFIDDGTRRHAQAVVDRLAWPTRLRLVDFTRLFRLRFYLVPRYHTVSLMIGMASPEIEALFDA